jgi:hypothetical protein
VSDDDASEVAHDLRLARRMRQLYAQRRGDQLSFIELAGRRSPSASRP